MALAKRVFSHGKDSRKPKNKKDVMTHAIRRAWKRYKIHTNMRELEELANRLRWFMNNPSDSHKSKVEWKFKLSNTRTMFKVLFKDKIAYVIYDTRVKAVSSLLDKEMADYYRGIKKTKPIDTDRLFNGDIRCS